MTDALTNYIVDRTSSSSPFVLKYVPYGALAEVRLSTQCRLDVVLIVLSLRLCRISVDVQSRTNQFSVLEQPRKRGSAQLQRSRSESLDKECCVYLAPPWYNIQ